MASFGVGGEFGVGGKFDNGGRFDLRLPYAEQVSDLLWNFSDGTFSKRTSDDKYEYAHQYFVIVGQGWVDEDAEPFSWGNLFGGKKKKPEPQQKVVEPEVEEPKKNPFWPF